MLAFPLLLLAGQWCASWVHFAKGQNLPERKKPATPLQSVSLWRKQKFSVNASQSSVKSLWITGVVTWRWCTCSDHLTVAQGESDPSYSNLRLCSLKGGQHWGRVCLRFPYTFALLTAYAGIRVEFSAVGLPRCTTVSWMQLGLGTHQSVITVSNAFPFCTCRHIGLDLPSAACCQNCCSWQMQRLRTVPPLYSSTQG